MKINDLFVPFEDELQLLPSKRAPDAPLIEWKSAFGDFYFRLKGSEPSVLCCVLGCSVTPRRPLLASNLAKLSNRISRVFASRTFLRVLPFDDSDDWLLARPRTAVVKSADQKGGALWWWKAKTNIPGTHRQWLDQPQEPLKAWLREFERDVPLQMARHCATLGESTRPWTTGATAHPSQVRFELLTRAALVLATPAWASFLEWTLQPSDCVPGVFHFRCTATVSLGEKRYPLHSKPAELLVQWLQRHLALPFWRGLNARGGRQKLYFPRYAFDCPSQHERLESLLVWRDFAREIGKSEEIEALLRELMSGEPL